MTLEDVVKRCGEWVCGKGRGIRGSKDGGRVLWNDWRRVECAEPDGPRRTWLLFEGGRQVGHVRGRCVEAEAWDRRLREAERRGWVRDAKHDADELRLRERVMPWTWEAAGSGRDILGSHVDS